MLAIEKRELLAANGYVTRRDFRDAWDRCWLIMVLEHAWPHKTRERRAWREAMLVAKSEFRAAFLDAPSAFSFAAGRLQEAALAMCLQLEPEQLGRAVLAAIAYVEGPEDVAAALRASDAASAFVEYAAA